jgi:hypothetical protein
MSDPVATVDDPSAATTGYTTSIRDAPGTKLIFNEPSRLETAGTARNALTDDLPIAC